jgi:hypothetical protein
VRRIDERRASDIDAGCFRDRTYAPLRSNKNWRNKALLFGFDGTLE